MIKRQKNTFSLLLACLILGISTLEAEVIYSIPLKGQEHQIGSLLNWTTSNEINSQVFIVEKSQNGVDYQVIGELDAAGHSKDDNDYRFLDVGVNDETSYYRLRQLDTDGTASFSQTIVVDKTMPNNFMVLAMTNTVTNNRFTVTLDAVIDDHISYSVKNREGETVFHAKEELYFGINEITVDVEDEPEGTYFVVMDVKGEKERLVIRKVEDEIKKKENVASKKQNNGG